MSQTVIQIVKQSLSAQGYTGLYQPDAECGCELDDLAPCGQIGESCKAGHKHFKPGGTEQDFAIFGSSTQPSDEQFEDIGI